MGSPSSYKYTAYALSVSIGKQLRMENEQLYALFFAGYSFLHDKGFGTPTIIGLIGNKEARNLVSTFFDPKNPLGSKSGHALSLQTGVGYDLKNGIGAELTVRSILDLKKPYEEGGPANMTVPASVWLKIHIAIN